MTKKTFTYQALTDDLVQNRQQDYQLPADDPWELPVRTTRVRTIRALCGAAAFCYSKLWRGVTVVGAEKLAPFAHQGYLVYGNHTQPVNDVALPYLIGGPQHFYALAAPANWGLPIRRLLRPGGAIPVAKNLRESRAMLAAIRQALAFEGHLFIYPEAHVWPGYTKIRPFPATSFRFAVEAAVPVFTLTTTYQGWRLPGQARLVAYVDGPFEAPAGLNARASRQWLHDQVFTQMQARAALNTIEPYHYQERRVSDD